MRNYEPPARCLARLDRFNRFRHCANLVQLDEHGIGRLLSNATLNEVSVRDVKIISHYLGPIAQCCRQRAEAVPVILAKSVLD